VGRFRSSPVQSKGRGGGSLQGFRRRTVLAASTGPARARLPRDKASPGDKFGLVAEKGAARSNKKSLQKRCCCKGGRGRKLGLGVDARADRPAVRRAGGVKTHRAISCLNHDKLITKPGEIDCGLGCCRSRQASAGCRKLDVGRRVVSPVTRDAVTQELVVVSPINGNAMVDARAQLARIQRPRDEPDQRGTR
jgi:hypothetical protein